MRRTYTVCQLLLHFGIVLLECLLLGLDRRQVVVEQAADKARNSSRLTAQSPAPRASRGVGANDYEVVGELTSTLRLRLDTHPWDSQTTVGLGSILPELLQLDIVFAVEADVGTETVACDV